MENIITQFNIKKQVVLWKKTEIKSLIGRFRLKISTDNISFYLYYILLHTYTKKSFTLIHKNSKFKDLTYQNFMHHIVLLSPLMILLFKSLNSLYQIESTSDFNITDTTLIPIKQEHNITQADWKNNKVTTRKKNNTKIHICGYKGLIFLNSKNKVFHIELKNINYSDMNILKESAFYCSKLKTNSILLFDKGFNSKLVRERLRFSNIKPISPYRKSEKTQLTVTEWNIYKLRWKIETVFQTIKYYNSLSPLSLEGFKHIKIIKAKFYSTFILFNLNHQ